MVRIFWRTTPLKRKTRRTRTVGTKVFFLCEKQGSDGRLAVPLVLGNCAKFTFHDLCGLPLGSADYLELCRRFGSFIVTHVPRMSFREKDLARRFIVFIDAVYESKVSPSLQTERVDEAKIVLTSEVPIAEIFTGEDPVKMETKSEEDGHGHVDSGMRSLMDDLGISMDKLLESSIFV